MTGNRTGLREFSVAMLWFVCFFNYAEAIVKYHAQLYDVRIEDLRQRQNQNLNIEIGRGLIDLAAILRRAAISEVHRVKFTPAKQRSRPR